ncbi:hypothetical protein CJ030_MR1G028214 [Morella rubra]|uniref:PGG domain-containing protein n=1 Tax=Morella rubra TaxID=262757 RepID=A0A6A1WR13_9ROSI|nr:hypothetical protein CJ030_MR1G028214 [Morella rubra]
MWVEILGVKILHLCVKQNQLEALKKSVEALDDNEFVNAKGEVEINATIASGFTALDLLPQSRRDAKDLDISEALRGAGALKATESPSFKHMTRAPDGRHVPSVAPRGIRTHQTSQNRPRDQNTKREDWLSRKTQGLMVVASLIAAMAFQAGVNPSGGLWQDDPTNGTKSNNSHHAAGTAIMAEKHQQAYSQYLAYNTIGFVASLSIILLLVTRRLFMWILTVIVWVAYTYSIAILVFTPEKKHHDAAKLISHGVV